MELSNALLTYLVFLVICFIILIMILCIRCISAIALALTFSMLLLVYIFPPIKIVSVNSPTCVVIYLSILAITFIYYILYVFYKGLTDVDETKYML